MSQIGSDRYNALFNPLLAGEWGWVFAAAAIGDPKAAKALADYIGPNDQPIKQGGRARVHGDEHFARTLDVIIPGFTAQGANYAKLVAYTNKRHNETRIPADLLAAPIRWVMLLSADVAFRNKGTDLIPLVMGRAAEFARHIHADVQLATMSLADARRDLWEYFDGVTIAPEQAMAFWATMRHPRVVAVMGRVDYRRVESQLLRYLPPGLVQQYMAHRPR